MYKILVSFTATKQLLEGHEKDDAQTLVIHMGDHIVFAFYHILCRIGILEEF